MLGVGVRIWVASETTHRSRFSEKAGCRSPRNLQHLAVTPGNITMKLKIWQIYDIISIHVYDNVLSRRLTLTPMKTRSNLDSGAEIAVPNVS